MVAKIARLAWEEREGNRVSSLSSISGRRMRSSVWVRSLVLCFTSLRWWVAGYAEPMRRVFGVNEGFRRRITKTFTFSDLSPTEIGALILLKMERSDENSPLHGFW